MLILTSPAKTLDYETPWSVETTTSPHFLTEAKTLISVLKNFSVEELQELMDISPQLAELNHQRFQDWKFTHTYQNSKPAVLAYHGDIFREMTAPSYLAQEQRYAQQNLRIISGLYGLVHAYDLIEPYRLEMSIKLKTKDRKNLYEFWQQKLTQFLETEIQKEKHAAVINLASHEYAKAIDFSKLPIPTVTITFHQLKQGKRKNFGLLAKKARGQMIEFMITHQIEQVEELKRFKVDGYRFREQRDTTLFFEKSI